MRKSKQEKLEKEEKRYQTAKMPDLAWDIAEAQLTQRTQKRKQPKHDTTPTNTSHGNHPSNSHCKTDNNTN